MQLITIENPSDADQRIDKFLKKYFPNATLGALYKWLRTGKIKVNKKKVEQTYRISIDDVISIFLSDEEILGLKTTNEPQVEKKGGMKMLLDILYEDDGFLVVNKPAGINVHPGDHKSSEASLIELVHDYLGGQYDSLSFRPSLVHRIDRDTSGTLIIAKQKKVLETLLSLLQNGKIEKVYHALVLGKPPKSRDTIVARLERKENAKDEAKVQVHENGQEAITHYSTLQENINERYTLLECRIETGRTHQIRVHLAHIGTPILGDKAYGNKQENSFAKKYHAITRQLLHAYSLSFPHPITKKQLTIHAPYPDDMKEMIHKTKRG